MASTTRLLDRVTLTEGDRLSAAAAPDLGDGSTLEMVVEVHEAADGEAPTLCLLHAASADDAAWLEFPTPVRVSLSRTGRSWLHAPRFTRYVGWMTAGSFSSAAVVTVDLVAKP